MALPSSSFIVGLLVLLYLSTFVAFALLRIITGVSIQRVGYSGFRRIAFTPKEGIRVDIRGLGFGLHRPTFAQPTWFSIVLTELKVTIDLKTFGAKPPKRASWVPWSNGSADARERLRDGHKRPSKESGLQSDTEDADADADEQRSRTWQRLTELKERIKRLHRKIQWLRMVDLVATNSSLVIPDIGTIQVANYTMAVDTRRKTVDRSRLFQHRNTKTKDRSPVEWIFVVRSILFSPEGKESTEILDHCTLNVHGLIYKELEGLRDASISLKLGRFSLPYYDIETSVDRIKHCRQASRRRGTGNSEKDMSFIDIMEELDKPGSREESIVQAVSDSKEFISSILRGVQEFQFAVGFFGLSIRLRSVQPSGSPVYLNVAMKEVGIDLLRLDSRSPAHLMYFAPDDVAHQALLAAIAISVGIDDGHDHPERLLYIPMVTATVKTTLPSKTIQVSKDKNVAERNANILFANLVVTSPSVDLDTRHLPVVLVLLQRHRTDKKRLAHPHMKRHLLSRLLPKASIKVSVHEPVVRVSLPPIALEKKDTGEFDLLISAMSSMSLDVESSHSADGELHYSLASNFRITSHSFYYQTASREKHNLLVLDNLEIKVQVNASPEVAVAATGSAQTFSIYMVRPEISEGVRQIVAQLRTDVMLKPNASAMGSRPNFLRRLPSWLVHVQLQGSDFNVEVAGVDPEVSKHARGAALHLESWSAEYKANKNDNSDAFFVRRRAASVSVRKEDGFLRPVTPSSPKKRQASMSDGRRLAVHTQGLEAFVIESADTCEPESFLSLPRFEVAFTTSTDNQGPVFHINSFARNLYVHYSLYRHFAVGIATMVLRKTFAGPRTSQNASQRPEQYSSPKLEADDMGQVPSEKPEILTLDFKAAFVQVKATMPSDPPLMLQLFSMEAGRHRWATPFARARLVRLYAEAPNVKRVWSRIVSLKSPRLDFRHSRRKYGTTFVNEKSIDVATDAIRLAVPHQLVVHKIFDNITNVAKTVQQLHHRFKTGTDEYVLKKHPEGPKRVPRISVRSQALLFEIEDSSFEWKLGVIYRQGLLEQKQRLAREDAFKLKVKKLKELETRRGNSRNRAKSAHQPRGRNKHRSDHDVKRSSSTRHPDRGRSSRPGTRGKDIRYDTEGTCGMSNVAQRTIEQARLKLDQYNAQSWKKRIDRGLKFQNRAMQDIRSMFWGLDEMPDDVEQKEKILAIPQRPALMAVLISDLNIVIDKSSFPLHEYRNFLHRVGKGMPFDMQYSLLIPMNVSITMGEARQTLRDYPLPLLHIPAIRAGQSPRLPSLAMKTDFVIAEEFRDDESVRHVQVVVVPPEQDASGRETGGFSVDVRRTVSPVKTYSDMDFDINTSYPTRITWGTSYQPVIQDMMQVIEGFTKPAIDPSERVGFWDKIRLTFHSRVNVAWKGDGDVHLVLKGSRDPYMVTGPGAGFVMCWRNDVRWRICQDNDPKRFMTVDSGVYVLAIPDLSHYARRLPDSDVSEDGSVNSGSTYKQQATFRKTVMKLSGNVQWLAGLVFERNVGGGRRSFEFKPHYEVVLKNPKFVKPNEKKDYDAFRGFRSHHIHMSVAVAAPVDRDWEVTNLKPSSNYNSVHLTPRFFSHFFSWWSLFSGVMSLPIRQGKLWPGIEKSSKKFGRHLATMKYNLLLSPLFISHIYKHKEAADWEQGVVSATGLKLRLNSFMLDLHQRREEFRTQVKGNSKPNKTSGMRINQTQLDFISADIRAVSATIAGINPENIDEANAETLASYQQDVSSVDLSRFTIPDNDLTWIDMDDFVELDWILPTDSAPETKILPLAFAPRFTYFRQTDHQDSISGDPTRSSPWGNEPTHYCVMTARNDPRCVQIDLIEERLARIHDQIAQNKRVLGEQQLKSIRAVSGEKPPQQPIEALQRHNDVLHRRQEFLRTMLRTLHTRLDRGDLRAVPSTGAANGDEFFDSREEYDPMDNETEDLASAPIADVVSEFNNRFIIHNAQLKWSNSLRNIILRYIHQVSQRRGFVYYMSRRAVKFILDIVEEQSKSREPPTDARDGERSGSKAPSPLSLEGDDELSVQSRIQQLLGDGKKFVNANDPVAPDESRKPAADNAGDDISREFTPQNTYHVRLIAPQIQLQSEKNTKSAVLVTAKGMELKVIQIMDKDRVSDEVSGLVQRRFSVAMDSLQMFVTNSKAFSTEYFHMHSGNCYGASAGSSWPPWVPIEAMYEFNIEPYGFSRVVQRTSASLRYDKYNTLRLKYNDDISTGVRDRTSNPDNTESRIDHLWIDFPHVRAICDSMQYYAMYIIVLDLLLYSEPLEKTRSERLEKIMLASDFSDLTGAPEMVSMLQDRIRQLEEIKMYFQVNEKYLDKQGWKDRIAVEQDLATCEDELFFMMKAITTSQRKSDERAQATQSTGLLRWNIAASEIVWHLMRGKDESLAEFQLKNALYDRTDNNDGSNLNTMEIERINGLNLLPNATYPEMIAPFIDHTRSYAEGRDSIMLRVQWYMLEAIAGIPVMDFFEVDLFPLKVQLEREVGKKLFEYIFPGVGTNGSENGGRSPFMIKHTLPPPQEENESDDNDKASGHTIQTHKSGHVDMSSVETDATVLEMRLRPTLTLPDNQRPKSSSVKQKTEHLRSRGNLSHLRLFNQSHKAGTELRKAMHAPRREFSADSLTLASRAPIYRTSSHGSMANGSTTSIENTEGDRSKRFTLHRSNSERQADGKETRSDDLTQMVSRASNYMTLAYVKVPSVVLCLSYKGKGQRNFEDVHDLVFRMPTLEYRNKTWSNLDLALQLKKDVIRALIHHAGAIVGNKLSHRRPNRLQQSRLREMANSSTVLNSPSELSGVTSESNSTIDLSPVDGSDTSEPRASFASGRGSDMSRTGSFASSLHSGNGTQWPAVNQASGGNDSLLQPFATSSTPSQVERDRDPIRNTMARHLPSLGKKTTQKDSNADESDEADRRKGRLLLGKKFLQSLPHP